MIINWQESWCDNMLGLGSLVGNSGCNRIGCRSSKCQNILTVPIALVDKIYRNANDSVCESHFQELSLFSDNKVWYWEYDVSYGCIDYYSEKKTARKNFGNLQIIISYNNKTNITYF